MASLTAHGEGSTVVEESSPVVEDWGWRHLPVRTYALGFCVLLLVIGISAAVFFSIERRSPSIEVGRVTNSGSTDVQSHPPMMTDRATDESEKVDTPSGPQPSAITEVKPSPINPNYLAGQRIRQLDAMARKQKSLNKPRSIATTRGPAPCGEAQTMTTEISKENGGISIKWSKRSDAKKYSLYIYDSDEILIDKYETDSGTSYITSKPFFSGKSYRWRLVIELNDGRSVIGTATSFKVDKRGTLVNGGSTEKIGTSIRCVDSDKRN